MDLKIYWRQQQLFKSEYSLCSVINYDNGVFTVPNFACHLLIVILLYYLAKRALANFSINGLILLFSFVMMIFAFSCVDFFFFKSSVSLFCPLSH